MSSTSTNRPSVAGPLKKGDIAIDAIGSAAHLAHEGRMLKTLATDAVEEGAYATRRAVRRLRRRVEELADTPAELAHRIRREPLKAVAMALGVGLFAGAAINWGVRRLIRHCKDEP